jgi:hypothetical protein
MSRWLFEPPFRVRQGGSAAEYAFSPSLDVFVREVVQNAKDQKADDPEAPVRVHFQLVRLRGKPLDRFQETLEWPGLAEHLRAAGQGNPNMRSLKRRVEQLEQDLSLLLLRIDDFGTGGLVGGDLEEDRPFTSLCVDELFSVKKSEGAGGSYGLGKSVLWRFSGFSTVLFSSYPSEYPSDGQGLRLFGRAQLPWHKVGHEPFQGTCWFGRRVTEGGKPTALSFWGESAAKIAIPLWLNRANEPGTSILVVDFSPPAEDVIGDREIAKALVEAASKHFWPVLGDGGAQLQVASSVLDAETGLVEGEQRAVGTESNIQPFAQCLRDFRDGATTESLEAPGKTARVDLDLRIPARVDGGPAVTAPVSLCVRLAQGPAKKLNDHVAEARGFGMVVRYRDLRGLSLSARRFNAVLICGRLRGDSEPDHAAEEFLRYAEPPGHDRWTSTPRLRDLYKRGYNRALEDLDRAVADALKRLVSQPVTGGVIGPDRLSMLFPIGERGHQVREHGFKVKSRTAKLLPDGRWSFAAEVERSKGQGAWIVRLRLRPGTEDGADAASVVGDMSAMPACPISLIKGAGQVTVPESVRKVTLSGRSDPALHRIEGRRFAMRLEIAASSVGAAKGEEG